MFSVRKSLFIPGELLFVLNLHVNNQVYFFVLRDVRRTRIPARVINLTIRSNRSNLCYGVITFRVRQTVRDDDRWRVTGQVGGWYGAA